MKIDNKQAANRTKIWLVRMPLLIVLVLLVLTIMEVLPSTIWLIISAGYFFISLLVVLIGRFHYVNFSFKQKEIVIRFFHLFPLITDHQEIRIQHSDNPNFLLKKSFFGMIPILNITINTSQGKASFPPISLSLLSKKALHQLMVELKIS